MIISALSLCKVTGPANICGGKTIRVGIYDGEFAGETRLFLFSRIVEKAMRHSP